MATIKNNWLRACLSLIVLLFGVFIVVKAMERENVSSTEDDEVWFDYTSSSTSSPDYDVAANYHIAGDGSEEPDCPNGSFIRCAVKAKPSGSNPDQPDMGTVTAVRNRAQ